MNVNTGELRAIADKMELEELKKEWGDSLREVPESLKDEANKVLHGNSRVFVDLKADTPLANFAKKERNKQKKSKRKMVQASRKRNR
jgi:sulfur transfer protein SufE